MGQARIVDLVRRAKISASLRGPVLKKLRGGLWHTTHLDRYRNILTEGSIVPEPNIPNSDRWKTSQGEDYYPYVRMLGGVSLFDFDEFDPERYTERYPASSW